MSEANLKIHNDRLHKQNVDKPFKCEVEGCIEDGKSFLTNGELTRHMKVSIKYLILIKYYKYLIKLFFL